MELEKCSERGGYIVAGVMVGDGTAHNLCGCHQTDLRRPVKGHPDLAFCAAFRDPHKERGCSLYVGTVAACSGEVRVCCYRGDTYPLLGHSYCVLGGEQERQ